MKIKITLQTRQEQQIIKQYQQKQQNNNIMKSNPDNHLNNKNNTALTNPTIPPSTTNRIPHQLYKNKSNTRLEPKCRPIIHLVLPLGWTIDDLIGINSLDEQSIIIASVEFHEPVARQVPLHRVPYRSSITFSLSKLEK